jgi:hypothetical protein
MGRETTQAATSNAHQNVVDRDVHDFYEEPHETHDDHAHAGRERNLLEL